MKQWLPQFVQLSKFTHTNASVVHKKNVIACYRPNHHTTLTRYPDKCIQRHVLLANDCSLVPNTLRTAHYMVMAHHHCSLITGSCSPSSQCTSQSAHRKNLHKSHGLGQSLLHNGHNHTTGIWSLRLPFGLLMLLCHNQITHVKAPQAHGYGLLLLIDD